MVKRILILSLILFSTLSFTQVTKKFKSKYRTTKLLVTKLYVKKTPSTQANWFQSIEEALEEASVKKNRMIHITVHPGTYNGRLRITRSTTIVAERPNSVFLTGSISNGGGHNLSLANLGMRNCRPYALIQRGGTLKLKDFSIHGTRRSPGDAHSGIAMDLGEGVKGHFTNVTLNNNQGLALYIHGSRTRVLAFRLTAKNNKINPKMYEKYVVRNQLASPMAPELAGAHGNLKTPFLLSVHNPQNKRDQVRRQLFARTVSREKEEFRLAAVEVANGALLLAKNPVIENNEFIGLFVCNGGRAHLRDGRVTNTRGYGREEKGGNNISVINRSRLELRNMYISGADFAGLQIYKSWGRTSDTIIENNYTGLHIGDYVEPGYDPVPCLTGNRTQIRNNHERNIDYTFREVPDTGLPSDYGGEGEGEQGRTCPGVPWEFNPN
jgi:hypothetical protein